MRILSNLSIEIDAPDGLWDVRTVAFVCGVSASCIYKLVNNNIIASERRIIDGQERVFIPENEVGVIKNYLLIQKKILSTAFPGKSVPGPVRTVWTAIRRVFSAKLGGKEKANCINTLGTVIEQMIDDK